MKSASPTLPPDASEHFANPLTEAALHGITRALASVGRAFICLDPSFTILHASHLLDRFLGEGASKALCGRPVEELLGVELFGPTGPLRQALLDGQMREGWRATLKFNGVAPRLASITTAPLVSDNTDICDPMVRYLVLLRPADEEGTCPNAPVFYSGASHTLNFQMNLPQVVSIGTGISPAKGTRIGLDVRWFNYENTAGFDEVGYDPDDSVAGFGWKNVWAVGGGIQQRVSKSTRIMAGYNYSGNPVPAKYTFFNTPAPAIVQHHVSGGITQNVGKLDMTVTYYHAFQNSITGPWISGLGAIPGTSVTSRMSENSVTIGVGKSF